MHNYTAYQPAYSHRKKSKKVKFVAGAPTEKALLNEKADIGELLDENRTYNVLMVP